VRLTFSVLERSGAPKTPHSSYLIQWDLRQLQFAYEAFFVCCAFTRFHLARVAAAILFRPSGDSFRFAGVTVEGFAVTPA
jgi:hypothetical protein